MPEIEWKNLNQSGQDRILEGSYDLLNRKDTLTKVDRQNFIDTATRNRMNDPKFIVKMQQDYYARHHEWYGPALKSTPFDDSGKEYNDENGNHLGPGPSLEDKPKNEPSEDGKPASDKPLGKEKQSATPPDDLPLLVSLGKSVTDWTPSDLARVVASTAFTDPKHAEHDEARQAVRKFGLRRSLDRTGPGGAVHVGSHDRVSGSGTTHVQEYWRSRPGS